MTKTWTVIASFLVAFTVAAPADAAAQAERRGSRPADAGSGDGPSAVPRVAAPSRPASPTAAEQPRRGATGASPESRPAASSGDRPSNTPRTSSVAIPRPRGSEAPRGLAQPRTNVDRPPVVFRPDPRDYRWRWYSGHGYLYDYGYRYGYYHGYYSAGVFDPWWFGGWTSRRPGWHDPFLFGRYGYGPYPYYWSVRIEGSGDVRQSPAAPTGAVRLRVSPDHARVYVDGALAGVAREFGGLSNHLDLPAGVHQLELRADGYVTYAGEITVRANRTQTQRISLEAE